MRRSHLSLALLLLAPALTACTPAPDNAPAPPPAAQAPVPPPSAAAGARAAVAATTVPSDFVGEWNMDLADCGTSRNDSRLVIEPSRIMWWESSGPVTRVAVHGPREITLTSELSGEGEAWTATTRFVLGEDGSLAATDVSSGGTLTRLRCTARPD